MTNTATVYQHSNGHSAARQFAEIEAMTNAVPTLGWSVMWFMGGLEAEHGVLNTTMNAVGLGDFVPKPPSPRVALHRALTAMVRQGALPEDEQSVPDEDRKCLVRTINDYNKEWIVFAVVGEAANFGTLSLNYDTQLRIKLHKKTGSMVCVRTGAGLIESEHEDQALALALDPYWQHYRYRHLSRDLSVVLKSIIDWASAISLRREGGVYFVPEANRDTLDQVRQLLNQLTTVYGGEPIFLTLGVPDEAETRLQMSRAAYLALVKETDEWLESAQAVLDSDKKTRDRTYLERLGEFHTLRFKMDAYGEILASRQGDLDARFKKAKDLAGLLALM